MVDGYLILEDWQLKFRIFEIIPKERFVVIKFGSYRTDKFFCNVEMDNKHVTSALYKDMELKCPHFTHRHKVKPSKSLRWDDYHRGRTTTKHMGQVERNVLGNPIIAKRSVVIYGGIGGV